MGLFDRFKRQAKEAVDTNKITIQEGTPEADKIVQQREELLASIQKSKEEKTQSFDIEESEATEEQWDDFTEESPINPFSKEQDKKSRKIAQKAKKKERLNSIKTPENKPIDRMKTTTGRTLVATG